MARFSITEESLEDLKSESVPDDVLENLQSIISQYVMTEVAFLNLLQETIGEAQTGQYKSLIMHHARTGCRFINSLSFSPDGQTMAAGCAGGIITLSNVETGAEILPLPFTHDEGGWHVTSVGWSSDGQTLASGGQDSTVKLWKVKTGEKPPHPPGTSFLCQQREF